MNGQSPKAPTIDERAALARFDGRARFAAYVAHELRTPMATQRALLELSLADQHADTTSWRDVAEDVLAACLQQERLLEACLTFARSRCALTRRDRIDLATIVSEALCAHDPNGLDCVVALEPAMISGDRALLERLAANLVSNAIRHNLADGRIEVETRVEAGRSVLSVANSGPLIPPAVLRRLFQPFQRFENRRANVCSGLGLGLSIVDGIATAHNATLSARAPADGGLHIQISFPGDDDLPVHRSSGRRHALSVARRR